MMIFKTDHKSFVKSQRPENPLHPLFTQDQIWPAQSHPSLYKNTCRSPKSCLPPFYYLQMSSTMNEKADLSVTLLV